MCGFKKTNQTEGGEQLSHVDQKNGIKRKWKAVNASRGTPPTEKGNKNVQRKMAAVSIDSAGHSPGLESWLQSLQWPVFV